MTGDAAGYSRGRGGVLRTVWPMAIMLGCAGEVQDTADTQPVAAPTALINAVEWGCTEDDWRYQISTTGWADEVVIDLFLIQDWTGGPNADIWKETHALPNVAFAEDRSWTRWDLSLDIADEAAQVADESTAFICEIHTPAEIASRVQLRVSDQLADCGIWGQRSEDYFNVALRGECYCFDQDDGCGAW